MPTCLACLVLVVVTAVGAPDSDTSQPADSSIVQTWIDRAVAATGQIDDPEMRSFAHYHLARVLSRHGDAKQALESARQVTRPLQQLYALKYVAEAAQQSGDQEFCREAVAVAKPAAMKDPGAFIDRAYIEVCFAAGLPAAALEYADATYKPEIGTSTYQQIVSAYTASGDPRSAEQLIKSKNLGEQARLTMVGGYLAADDMQAAIKVIESVADTDLANRHYGSIATHLAHKGDNAGAQKYVALIQDDAARRRTAGEVARYYVQDDSLEELRAGFAAADSREVKSAILLFLVRKLCEAHLFAEADRAIEQAVEAISDDPQPDVSSKFGTYGDLSATAWARGQHLEIAKSLVEQGKLDEASEQVAKLATALDEVPAEAALVRWPLEPALIRGLLKIGRKEEALQRAEKMPGMSRAQAMAEIAVHEIEAGRVDEGLQLLAGPVDNRFTGLEKGDVALALLRTASVEKTADFLNHLEITDLSGRAFNQVAHKLVEENDLAKLEVMYTALDSPVGQAHYAMEAAERLRPGE
jgi:tetratricopeptide (TPR) repeat protein